jgi:hypothetical protein
MPTPKTAILLVDCPDRKGIVVTIVNFLVWPQFAPWAKSSTSAATTHPIPTTNSRSLLKLVPIPRLV